MSFLHIYISIYLNSCRPAACSCCTSPPCPSPPVQGAPCKLQSNNDNAHRLLERVLYISDPPVQCTGCSLKSLTMIMLNISCTGCSSTPVQLNNNSALQLLYRVLPVKFYRFKSLVFSMISLINNPVSPV